VINTTIDDIERVNKMPIMHFKPDFADIDIKTFGDWIETQKIKVVYINAKGEQKEVIRRIYFDTHDLYITIENMRYYLSDFEVLSVK